MTVILIHPNWLPDYKIKKYGSIEDIFILCETCHWCATYFDKDRLPTEKCPICLNRKMSSLLYSNHLLLLILTLVAKSFSTSYKELLSATNRAVEESMNGGNMKTPLVTLLSLFQPVCVCVRQEQSATETDNDLSHDSILYYHLCY